MARESLMSPSKARQGPSSSEEITISIRFRLPVSLLLLISAQLAWPQVPGSSFEGSWSGMITSTSTKICTGLGARTTTCSTVEPWSGSVDSQGNFAVTLGEGGTTCSDGTAEEAIPARGPYSYGQVLSNGIVSIPEYQSSSTVKDFIGTDHYYTSCPAWAFHFSPDGIAASHSCTDSAENPGFFRCDTVSSERWTGSRVQPVFPIAVASSFTSTSYTANVTARIQPRPQDMGTTASIFVFAHVPTTALTGGSNLRNVCVLAQVDSGGKLVQASPSTLRPYSTGVLSSQSQPVSILNDFAYGTLQEGASFLVGYGTTSSAMFASSMYQGAITIGSSPCTATQLGGAAPDSPGALSGLWWNASESGWGISITQRRDIVFAVWYAYDAAGNPKWHVASDCRMASGATGTNGTCNGVLYEVSGPAFFGASFDPEAVKPVSAGTLQLAFAGPNDAVMSYTVNGQSRVVPITRMTLPSGPRPPAVDYTDLWWNPDESGWGMAITHQFGVMFLAWYVYDSSGKPTWYVASDCVVRQSTCVGTVYRTTGPPLGPTFNSSSVNVFPVGKIIANFGDANNAALAYAIDGVAATKVIKRQRF